MDRIDLLQVFLRVAETGSFTRAADRLGLPRATISTAVQQLETRLGSRLLHRTTRRVSLTPDGEVMLERARALVADMEDIEQQFLPAHGHVSGRLKVDVPSRIARRLIAPALPGFFERFPGIELELGSSDRAVDLVLEGVDCALRVGPLASSSLVARPLGHFTLINCASPAYLAQHGAPRTPADLPQHIAVNYASPTSGRAAPWEWRRDGETHTLRLRSQVTTNNAESYIACALAGLGLIQIPAYDVREHLAAGELIEVMPDARAEPLPVHLVYPHRRNLSRRMQAFAGWLETLLADSLSA
ncbi:LysR substrate-binding domain-containing protein [Variovorax sp. GB1P17]|uniref:LysR substrate-binding domain-containing protein n=1 Tax=Variovorax sp. GB1P17 TaxID=3443740 RepID=UPI003F46889E